MTKKVSKLKTQARDLNSDFLISVEILSLLIGGPYQKFRSEDGCVISGFMGCSGSGFEAGMHQSGGFLGCIRVVVQRFGDAASGYNLHPAPHPQPDAPHPSLPIPQDFMFLVLFPISIATLSKEQITKCLSSQPQHFKFPTQRMVCS